MYTNKQIIGLCPNFYKIIEFSPYEDDVISKKLIKLYQQYIFRIDINNPEEVESVINLDKVVSKYIDDYLFRREMQKQILQIKVKKDAKDILKEKINKENTDNKDMLEEMKKVLEGNVEEVKLTNKLKSHPVCLTTTGEVSTSMEKVINAMPTDEKIKANEVLEINASHKIVDKLKDLYKNDKDEFTKYTKVIYYEARLIEGLPIDNPTELSNLMCDIMANK